MRLADAAYRRTRGPTKERTDIGRVRIEPQANLSLTPLVRVRILDQRFGEEEGFLEGSQVERERSSRSEDHLRCNITGEMDVGQMAFLALSIR